ncbi:MAG TPA: hypothetical protein VGH38_04745, partial [Bryobacteraceae bacterium]
PYVAELGWWPALAGFDTRLVYTFLLGTGICVSQLRAKRKEDRSRSWIRQRFVPLLGIAGFYCILYVFEGSSRTYGLREHFVFLGRLFGL